MEEKFGNGSVSKVFIKFAIPAILANILIMSAFFVDGILIGQIIGPEGLAAVNLVFPIFSMVAATGIAIAAGSSSLIGKYLGQKNKLEANKVFNLALALCIIFSLTISGLILFFSGDITKLLGATGSLFESTKEYLSTLVMFFGLILTSIVLEFFVRNEGDSVFPIKAAGIATGINIILTYFFLVFFDMGLGGAALATGISFMASIGILASYFLRKNTSLSYSKPIFAKSTIKKILHNGSSESLSEFSSGIVILIFNLMLLQYLGEIGVSTFAIISFISLTFLMVIFGFSMALQPMVSYNFGAKLINRVKETLKVSIIFSTSAGFAFYLLVWIFGDYLIGLFDNGEGHLTTMAFDAIRIYGLAYIFMGINMLTSAYLTALGQPKFSLFVSMSYTLIFVVIGLVAFPQFMGTIGIWWAVPFANIVTVFVSIFFIKRSNGKLAQIPDTSLE